MGIIADLVLKLRHVLDDGVAVPDRSTINFIGGTVADNPVEGRIDVTIGGGVATLGVTAPILNTGTSSDPVVAISAATTTALGAMKCAGDLGGTGALPSVLALRGAVVGSAGGALAVGRCLRVTGGATCDWGALDLADSDAVTGVLPAGNQAEQTMAGDVSGSTGANTVDAIRETTIGSAGGALATGAVLRVTGPASCDWGAVDLADGDAVTGLLPTGNVDASSTPTASKIVKTGASNEVGLLYFDGDGLSFHIAPSFGGGQRVIGIGNASAVPTTAPTGGVVAYAEAGAAKVWSPRKLRSSLAPETNNAATDQRLDAIHQTVTTADATPTVIATYALPTACCFVARIFVTGQQTGTDTTAVYAFDVTAKRAAGACVVTAPTVTTLIDSIGVAAVPSVTNATNDVQFSVTGKAATSIDWAISSVHVHLFSV